MTRSLGQQDPSERTDEQALQEKLVGLHTKVADVLIDRLGGHAVDDKGATLPASDADIRAALSLLKQNNIVVEIVPGVTNHRNELQEAREQAEKAKTPFGKRASGDG